MFNKNILMVIGLALVSPMDAFSAPDDFDAYKKEIVTERTRINKSIQSPGGLLSTVGRHWLEQGRFTIGSAANNDIVIIFGSDYLGQIENTERVSRLHLNTDAKQPYKRNSSVETVVLLDKGSDNQNPKYFLTKLKSIQVSETEHGRVMFLSDHVSLANKEFKDLEFYDVSNDFHIVAEVALIKEPKVIEIGTVWGGKGELTTTAIFSFEFNDKEYELQSNAIMADGRHLVFFADLTSGEETYGGGRLFLVNAPKDGKVILDFNKAANKMCAYSSYTMCPLTPKVNRLDLAVTAGEKKYKGARN